MKKNFLTCILAYSLTCLMPCMSLASSPDEKKTSGNPVLPGWYADPEGVVFGDEYWIFPTLSDYYAAPGEKQPEYPDKKTSAFHQHYNIQTYMDAFSSKDLVHWTKHPEVLTVENVKWVKYALWAPSAIEHNGKYYLFFSGNDITEAKRKQTLEMLKDTITPSFDLGKRLKEICADSNEEFKAEIEEILKINSVGRKGRNYELKIQSAIKTYREIGIPESEINPLLTIGVGAAGTILSSAFAEEVLSTALDNFLPTTISDALSGPLGLGFGILLGLGINYTGIKLDELINRKKYKESLVKYIEKERSLYLEELEKTFSLHEKRAKEICLDSTVDR